MFSKIYKRLIPLINKNDIRNHHHINNAERRLSELYRNLGENYLRDSDIEVFKIFKELDSLENFINNKKKKRDKKNKEVSEE